MKGQFYVTALFAAPYPFLIVIHRLPNFNSSLLCSKGYG